LQQEAEVKTKKLKRLVTKISEAKNEIKDLQSEWQREKEDMLDSVRDLTHQLKLKLLIINNFIPKDEGVRVEKRALWDEETQTWKVGPLTHSDPQMKHSKRPMSAAGNSKRPTSEYARVAKSLGDNPRFKADNIITLDLDMPERTTTGNCMIKKIC
jgi:kinesin family member 3B